jgi:hypothetical protein
MKLNVDYCEFPTGRGGRPAVNETRHQSAFPAFTVSDPWAILFLARC